MLDFRLWHKRCGKRGTRPGEGEVDEGGVDLNLLDDMEPLNPLVELEQVAAELAAFKQALRRRGAKADLPAGVEKALAYIHTNLFSETLDATRVRLQFRLTNNNIASRFKHHIGAEMQRYIESARLEAAKRLLRHEDLSVLKIAWSVGYAYPESFARAFKRYMGVSASEYRAQMLRRTVKTRRNEGNLEVG